MTPDNIPDQPDPIHQTEFSTSEPVWTFRGYELDTGNFTTAMVHFFRAEVTRANVWRQRLDATTNWAVVTTAAVLTFVFGSESVDTHSVIVLNMLLITIFLYIEARRYRYYELWSYRVRLMETDFFAAMLVPPFRPAGDWAESVAENLLQPNFPISMWEAFGRRYRRNYLWLYLLLILAWFLRITLYPDPVASWEQIMQRASLGMLSGEIFLGVGALFNVALLAIGLLTRGLHAATGEVLPRYASGTIRETDQESRRPWFRRGGQRQQYMTWIITDHAEEVAERILEDMKRGVTQLTGTGMYSGLEHDVLICALTATEIPHLKALIKEVDPGGFVIISPAQEILGRGFAPLKEKS